jgi:hypothetical protein
MDPPGALEMPVNLSIKQVPDELAERLRRRAARNHRSLQRELLTILEATIGNEEGLSAAVISEPRPAPYLAARGKRAKSASSNAAGRLTLDQLWERARQLGGPVTGESSASLIRRDRDERGSR